MTDATSLASNFEPCITRAAGARTASEPGFFGILTLLFATCAALTITWCGSMSAMGKMAMPGGWAMSMAWMRMPGQSWASSGARFLAMWVLMMVAMMLPSLVPMLLRYRQAVGSAGDTRPADLGRLTVLVALGYFSIWTALGAAVYPLGALLASIEMQQPMLAHAVPLLAGAATLSAGAVQFTAWKAHHLACCRLAPGQGRALSPNAGTAWKQGLHFGFHCGYSCLNLTVVLLVVGVMDLRAMAAVTAAITAERLAPAGERIARAIGAIVVLAGALLIAHTAGLSF